MLKNIFYKALVFIGGICIARGCYLIHPGLIWLFAGFGLMLVGLIRIIIEVIEEE